MGLAYFGKPNKNISIVCLNIIRIVLSIYYPFLLCFCCLRRFVELFALRLMIWQKNWLTSEKKIYRHLFYFLLSFFWNVNLFARKWCNVKCWKQNQVVLTVVSSILFVRFPTVQCLCWRRLHNVLETKCTKSSGKSRFSLSFLSSTVNDIRRKLL